MTDTVAMTSPASLLTVLDPSLYPVANALCTFLEIQDLINLARTCKKFYHFFHFIQRSQWSINKRLRYFVNDPTSFRSMIGQYEALISGSFALGFLDRVFWAGDDLDIYVQCYKDSSRVRGLGLYLIQEEGYRFLPTSGQGRDFEVASNRSQRRRAGYHPLPAYDLFETVYMMGMLEWVFLFLPFSLFFPFLFHLHSCAQTGHGVED